MAVTNRSSRSKQKTNPRDVLLQILPDGILVLDGKSRIVEINPAAVSIIDASEREILGKAVLKIFPSWPQWQGLLQAGAKSIVVSSPSHPDRTLEILQQSIPSGRGKNAGRLILVRDISERIRMEQDHKRSMEYLLEQSTKVQALDASLRQQAIRDPLTNLYNRCYLDETLNHELARAARSKTPISILMIRLDQYQEADRIYGDKAGIEIMKILSSLLYRYIRRGDIAGRYDREEFAIIMPGAFPSIAGSRAEQLRKAFHDSILNFLGSKIECTFSCGVASYPPQGDTPEALLQSAEKALQESIAAGGNRVTVCVS